MQLFVQRLISQFKKKEVQSIPDILAFNFMMALIPMLIVFFQILAFFSIETGALNRLLVNYLPAEIHNFIGDFLNNSDLKFSDSPVLLVVTIITLAFTVSKGVNGIFKAFKITYTPDQQIPGYHHRLIAIGTFFLILSFGAIATAFIATSHLFLAQFHTFFRTIIELLTVSVLCFSFFYLLFRFAPVKRDIAKKIIPGCLFTTAGFVISTAIFRIYVDRLANFHVLYGALAIIIILLTWLYLVGWVINIGIQINFLLNNDSANIN